MKPHILVVDDEATHRQMLELVLAREGYAITLAADGIGAVAAVEKQFYDLILMDIRMSGLGGIEALHQIRTLSPGIPVIMMTAYASVSTAVEALKSGAYDYLTKPLDIEELKILVAKALRHRQLEQENRYLKEQLDQQFSFTHIIGRSRPMQELFESL
ncbi:MAG: response regulator, partial [Desulfobacterales bacterium]|nr:response regulator [Desulfobacterales bacterium]